MARLRAGLSFHASTGGFSTRRGHAPSRFCSNSLLGSGQIPSLGLPLPVCKGHGVQRAFPQRPGRFMPRVAGFLSELQRVVSLGGPGA